jgi:hypothetical protein
MKTRGFKMSDRFKFVSSCFGWIEPDGFREAQVARGLTHEQRKWNGLIKNSQWEQVLHFKRGASGLYRKNGKWAATEKIGGRLMVSRASGEAWLRSRRRLTYQVLNAETKEQWLAAVSASFAPHGVGIPPGNTLMLMSVKTGDYWRINSLKHPLVVITRSRGSYSGPKTRWFSNSSKSDRRWRDGDEDNPFYFDFDAPAADPVMVPAIEAFFKAAAKWFHERHQHEMRQLVA